MGEIKAFFRKCRNVIRWLPTIWKDEDWDDSFIVDILIKKLEHQRDFFLSDRAYSAKAEETAAEIQKAIDGLVKTKDSWEHYEEPAHNELDKKWGEIEFKIEPGERLGFKELHISPPNVKTKEDRVQYVKELMDTMELTMRRYKKDKRAVYQFIADNIDKWWD